MRYHVCPGEIFILKSIAPNVDFATSENVLKDIAFYKGDPLSSYIPWINLIGTLFLKTLR